MPQIGKKSYGRIKVKRAKPHMDEVPDDCGYMKRFQYNIDMNSNGIMGDCIEWCQVNCKGKWGWWFEPAGRIENPTNHYEDQNAYMSFQNKRDATMFWLCIGAETSARNDGAYMK